MALNLPVFYKRTASAIVFGIIMLAGLLWNEWAFLVLVSLIQILCLRDYFNLVKKIDPEVYWPGWLPQAMQVFSLVWLWMSVYLSRYLPVLLFFPILFILMSALSRKTAWHSILQAFGGMLYIMLPMMLLYSMREMNMAIPIALILMLWMNDTMAYLVGSFIGRTPFSEISPKKTWEGTIGGAVLTIAGAAAWGYFSTSYSILDWVIIALCAVVAGTFGDLLESKLKRLANVKDSGTLMPGHGGALDRFDSLLVAAPFAFVYAYIFMN